MNKPNLYSTSDYVGLWAKNARFYYGYEETWCKECNRFFSHPEHCEKEGEGDHCGEGCFVANFGDNEIRIPSSKLSESDVYEYAELLLIGISMVLEKYKLVSCE